MTVITSRQNALIKERCKLQQRKFREKSGLFLIEGVRLVAEALQAGCLKEVFVEESLFFVLREQKRFKQIMNSHSCFRVTSEISRALAATETPQGIIGVGEQAQFSRADLLLKNDLIVLVDGLQDPGNLGTIWRTAWASGVDALFCLAGTVDPYNSKTIRASMGAVFHLPLIREPAWPALQKWCNQAGFQIIAGDLRGQAQHFQFTYPAKVALLLGSEGHGLTTVPEENIDFKVKIPLPGGAESLNVAVACGILLYEVLRQRNC